MLLKITAKWRLFHGGVSGLMYIRDTPSINWRDTVIYWGFHFVRFEAPNMKKVEIDKLSINR